MRCRCRWAVRPALVCVHHHTDALNSSSVVTVLPSGCDGVEPCGVHLSFDLCDGHLSPVEDAGSQRRLRVRECEHLRKVVGVAGATRRDHRNICHAARERHQPTVEALFSLFVAPSTVSRTAVGKGTRQADRADAIARVSHAGPAESRATTTPSTN